jgi:hypothetical protein
MSATEGLLKPIPYMYFDDICRFWYKVDKTDSCWNWIGKPNPDGYGMFQMRKDGSFLATRISWFIAHGEPGNQLLLHKCKNNRLCINTAHLYLGIQSDNMYDACRDGNANLSGDLARRAKFDRTNLPRIFERSHNGETDSEIARSYNVSSWTINRILRGLRY